MVSTIRKKSPNKRILFQVDRKSVYTSTNGEYVSTRRKDCLHWQQYLENQRKLLAIAVIKFLNRPFCNLSNAFH